MTKERARKRAHIEVQGEQPVEERMPHWEIELLVAAFARMEIATPVEDHDASR